MDIMVPMDYRHMNNIILLDEEHADIMEKMEE
jgi:hypothetical protein